MLELYQMPTSHSWQDTGAHKLSFSLAAVCGERKPRYIGWQGCTVLRENQILSRGKLWCSPKRSPPPQGHYGMCQNDLGTENSESSCKQMPCFHSLRHARFFYTEKNIKCIIHFHFCKTIQKVFVNVMLSSIWGKLRNRFAIYFGSIPRLQVTFIQVMHFLCLILGFTDLCYFCKQGNSIQWISLVNNLC